MKVQAESFHLNGHIIGFRLQTQKLDSPYKTPSNTLAVKGLRTDHVVSDGVGSENWGWLNDLKKRERKKISLQTNLEWKTFSHRGKHLIFATKKIRKKDDHNCGLRKIYIFNNYSPKAKLILLNNPQDEVEGIIHKLYHPVPIQCTNLNIIINLTIFIM